MFINISKHSGTEFVVSRWVSLLLLLIFGTTRVFACDNQSQTEVLQNNWISTVKSVKAYKTGRDLNNPIIELNTNETITVDFDDLSDEGGSYEYTFVHCTYDWRPSDLIFMDYCDGFEYNRVGDYRNSMGTTTTSYIHHSITFPNGDIRFRVSGNYVLRVVDSYDHDRVIIQQRFMVIEPLLSMSARVRQPLVQQFLRSSQQLELDVNTAPLGNIDPDRDVVTVICQNNQADVAMVNPKYSYLAQNLIRYTSPDALIFDGCNEYRSLNIKSYSYQTHRIRRIELLGAEMHIRLNDDSNCSGHDYTENPDLNGKYIVKRDDSNDSNTEADYAWVYFTLRTPAFPDADVYLYGEITGWTIAPDYKLKYNEDSQTYELRTLFKQGYYNYRYVTVGKLTGEVSHAELEGNHYSTENTYQVTVYYKSPSVRYWRLVGIKTISSRYSVN